MINTSELRRKVNSTDIVDHIDLHSNIRGLLSELLDRLEAAKEDRSNFLVEMGKLCTKCDALCLRIEAAEKERDALRTALEKIADWDSAWGPYPETNEAWRAMVIVTAREAVPRRGEKK